MAIYTKVAKPFTISDSDDSAPYGLTIDYIDKVLSLVKVERSAGVDGSPSAGDWYEEPSAIAWII